MVRLWPPAWRRCCCSAARAWCRSPVRPAAPGPGRRWRAQGYNTDGTLRQFRDAAFDRKTRDPCRAAEVRAGALVAAAEVEVVADAVIPVSLTLAEDKDARAATTRRWRRRRRARMRRRHGSRRRKRRQQIESPRRLLAGRRIGHTRKIEDLGLALRQLPAGRWNGLRERRRRRAAGAPGDDHAALLVGADGGDAGTVGSGDGEQSIAISERWARTRRWKTVSYDDALAFCRKLNERERAAGRLPEGYVYTLPTEAQWEYACRAGTTGDYAGDLASMAWYRDNSGATTHAVGQKQANGRAVRHARQRV